MKNFLFDLHDGIALLTINRPEVRNALNTECQLELIDFIDQVNHREDIKAVIITGTGEKAFAAGADIAGLKDRTMVTVLEGVFPKAFKCISECEKPVIAAVNGSAFGGGCELALASDIRIASENAKFCLPELGIGIMPGGGGSRRLARIIGEGRAKEIILTGRVVRAEEAFSIGLVSKVVPGDQLIDAATETAKMILEKGPLAVRLEKKVLNMALSSDEESARLMELFSYCMLIASEDRLEGMNAFLEKRKPQFKGN